jgi:HD-GYP domain-containing protein (c-di-GMP phosphodiesterase class II)
MTSDRPYRSSLSNEDALEEIRACSGTQFDPAIVEAFLAAYDADPLRFAPGDYPFELPSLKLVAS